MSNSTAKRHGTKSLRPETLLSSVAVLLLVNLVQRSVGFGRGIVFCRWLGPHDLGMWEMAYGFLLLAAPLSVLGLPGSFGRYLERYRQRGQLGLFLWRTTIVTIGLAILAIGMMFALRVPLAWLVFGDESLTALFAAALATLALVIAHHFCEAVFAGLRLYRVVSAMQFVQSLSFAAISISLMAFWQCGAQSVVLAYGAGCLLSLAALAVWILSHKWDLSLPLGQLPHREFWPPLMQFAVWVWVTNLLSNLFAVIDRYMILHCSGLSPEAALNEVGNYHTSMILPVLLVSVANLLVGAVTPHLSHDWELGRRQRVGYRLNHVLRFAAMGMHAVGVAVLLLAPTLFRFGLGHQYDKGLAVLPWTIAACVWFSLLLVAQTYAWCAERTRHATIPLVVGLSANIVLNLYLIPRFALAGAVSATAIATLLTLLTQLEVNRRIGMRVDSATWAMILAPLALAGGWDIAADGLFIYLLVAAVPGTVIPRRYFRRLPRRATSVLWRIGVRRPTQQAT